MTVYVYQRHRHAAHYYGLKINGHDLETWTVTCSRPLRTPQIPHDAELAHGDNDKGIQTWTWTRLAPMSAGTCSRCEGRR